MQKKKKPFFLLEKLKPSPFVLSFLRTGHSRAVLGNEGSAEDPPGFRWSPSPHKGPALGVVEAVLVPSHSGHHHHHWPRFSHLSLVWPPSLLPWWCTARRMSPLLFFVLFLVFRALFLLHMFWKEAFLAFLMMLVLWDAWKRCQCFRLLVVFVLP